MPEKLPTGRWPILFGAALMVTLAMGMRQSMGMLQPSVIGELSLTAADYSFAIALQNIVWGISQPFVGAFADRHGSRKIMIFGAFLYGAGLLIARYSTDPVFFVVGLGLAIGLAMSCCGSSLAMAVTSRSVAPAQRTFAMGAVTAAGSLGLMFVSPLAQKMLDQGGWQLALIAFAALAVVMVPAAYMAGGADKLTPADVTGPAQSLPQALSEAGTHGGYVVMAIAFFVCGLQLVFLTTHLPTYIEICGMPASVTAATLALIGLFNAIGSLTFGWLGGRFPKRTLLGGIYIARSLIITLFFTTVPTPTTTMLFGALMGSLWLGVVPLVNGLVIQIFGLRYMATLVGIAFFSHQVGSFVGAWGGGLIYASLGNYDWAWRSAVAIGLIAGVAQLMMNVQPAKRMTGQTAAA
ncbi:MAG: MFS transporter [Burkholderiaceae bacterium]